MRGGPDIQSSKAMSASPWADENWGLTVVMVLPGSVAISGARVGQAAGWHCQKSPDLRMTYDFGWHWRSLWTASVLVRRRLHSPWLWSPHTGESKSSLVATSVVLPAC